MACSSGCLSPGRHETWGDCVRAKHLQIQNVQAHKFNQSVRDDLDAYRNARSAGIQPASTGRKDVENAWRLTDQMGTPFRADA